MFSTVRFSANILRETFRFSNRTALKCCEKKLVPKFHSFPSLKRYFSANTDSGKEIQIPTPYGHIAAKEYGDPKGHPVIAVHGWLDNCGTFELLLPHIIEENNLHVVAIDETGCGLSSHLPNGAEYPKWSLVKDIRRVVNHFEWKNVSLIGHSRGAVMSLFFATIYPEIVQSVVAIDAFGAFYTKENYPYTDHEGLVLDKLLSFDAKLMKTPNLEETAPVYNEEEAVKRIMTATPFGLTEKTAKILMKRGAKKHKNGLIFTRDLRHKMPIMGPIPSKVDFLEFGSRIRCDLLVVMASKGPFSHFDTDEWFNLYSNKCRSFKHSTLRGKHYIHMDIPEEVASIINPFLHESILKGPVANREFL